MVLVAESERKIDTGFPNWYGQMIDISRRWEIFVDGMYEGRSLVAIILLTLGE